jgi:hypothetical protein
VRRRQDRFCRCEPHPTRRKRGRNWLRVNPSWMHERESDCPCACDRAVRQSVQERYRSRARLHFRLHPQFQGLRERAGPAHHRPCSLSSIQVINRRARRRLVPRRLCPSPKPAASAPSAMLKRPHIFSRAREHITQSNGQTPVDTVPFENRTRVVTCASSEYQAARAYSLIRPPRTGFRWIRLRSRSAMVR